MIDSENSWIVSAFVDKSNIIEYFPDSSEKEVLLLPSCAEDIQVETLYGVSSLAKEISAIMPTYQVYRREIAALYECSENDIAGHDAVHTLRVLFNALLLLEVGKIKLTGTEKRQLLTAIVYHDIGRANDSVDNGHGKASALFASAASLISASTIFQSPPPSPHPMPYGMRMVVLWIRLNIRQNATLKAA